MPPNSRWPDFRLASTLWSMVSSPSNGPDRPAASDKGSSKRNLETEQQEHLNDRQQLLDSIKRDPGPENPTPAEEMMTGHEEGPIDGLGGFADFEQPEHDAHLADAETGSQDDDFGPLEMFDSNATQPPFSQFNSAPFEETGRAPEAVMMEEAPPSQTRKSKREKKDKKKKASSEEIESSQPLKEEVRKQKKSKKKSVLPDEIPDSMPAHETPVTAEPQLPTPGLSADAPYATEETVVPSTQSKRKRKSSVAAEGKLRKKRKSQDRVIEAISQDVIQGTQEDNLLPASARPSSRDAEAAAFLHIGDGKEDLPGQESAPYEDAAAESDPQRSPSVARLRRRSQSRETRSRGNSVAFEMDPNAMDIDPSMTRAHASELSLGDQDLGADNSTQKLDGSMAGADHDVESLAREAWNEHINGKSQPEDVQMTDSAQQPPNEVGLYGMPQSPTHQVEPPSASSKRTRSARAKKAKPTYFEKSPSPEGEHRNALNELPSPSAMTPKPRSRTKRATKAKKPKAEPRLSQSMHGATDDEMDDSSRGRRNRMSGFTQGRFSDEELSRIARAVESFRAENDMTQHAVNEMIHAPGGTTAGEDHAILWNRIFVECPDRHRQKIINITRKKFHNFVARATWTIDQDTELRDLIEIHGTKWSKIAGIINRHPEDVRDRYRNYIVCGDNQRKDAWDEQEEGRLTQYVIEAMEVIDELRNFQPSRELLKKPYEELIDWQNISERMDRTRSRLQCITKWKAMNIKTNGKDKLVSREPDSQISFRLEKARRQIIDMPDEERYRLVLAIHESAAATESKIPWQRLLTKQFRSTWHRSTQMLLWRRLKHTVPNWEKMPVRDCAQYLLNQYNQTQELPHIKDEDYNDAQEMEYLATIPTSIGANGSSSGKKSGVSEEYIVDSDIEGEEAGLVEEAHGETLEQMPEDVVDPALSQTERPTKKSTPTQKTGTRKGTPGSKRSKKSVEPSQDPIEDYDEKLAEAAAQEDGSEIDEKQYRKKKTPSKFRVGASNTEASPHSQLSDSVMDDMEDLPARVAA